MPQPDLQTVEKPTVFCGFCGKSQHDVQKLIAGPTTCICNECVDLCRDICSENEGIIRQPRMTDGDLIALRKWALEQAWAWGSHGRAQMVLAAAVEAYVTHGAKAVVEPVVTETPS